MYRILVGFLSIISLLSCLAFPVLYFLRKTSQKQYKLSFLLASIVWFIFATLWAQQKKTKQG